VTLTNSGTGPLSISSITTSGDFAQSNNCPSTLGASLSCSIQVTFTPTATGSRTGTLSVTDNATGSPQSVSLSGTGIPNTSGPNAAAAVSQTSIGPPFNSAWVNPTNVLLNDGNDATALVASIPFSETLLITNFGFAIPSSATITGVQVLIKRRGTQQSNGAVGDYVVQLIKGGTQAGQNKAIQGSWATTYQTPIYGGANDLWGITLTPADVQAANFGVAIQIAGGNFNTASIDFVSMSITWQ
jgi:hypothetical protein